MRLHVQAVVLLGLLAACGSNEHHPSPEGSDGGQAGSMPAGGGGSGPGGSGAGGSGAGPVLPPDPSTIAGKHLMGYQGWFACPGDGAPPDRWVHWFRNDTPTAAHLTIDMWPDLTELDDDELFTTGLGYQGGEPAGLYSAWTEKTVVRHFAWMEQAGLDGVFLQRFLAPLEDPAFLALRDRVAENVRTGAETHDRVFALMYDVSGKDESTMVDDLLADWQHVVDDLELTESPRYLHHDGRPVLAVWGLGFVGRPGTPAQAQQLIDALEQGLGPAYRVTLMGGVPTHWRTLTGDSKTDPDWAGVYRSFDILSPWTVGRYVDETGADELRDDVIEPDLAELAGLGILYMPVVWPGFSWHNLNDGPLNQIPRNGGTFYWRQVHNAVSAGASLLYTAMFDEVDEGTAMFKIAPTQTDVPVEGDFVTLDADGQSLPSDWYLRLGAEASRMLRGDIPLTESIPISP